MSHIDISSAGVFHPQEEAWALVSEFLSPAHYETVGASARSRCGHGRPFGVRIGYVVLARAWSAALSL